MSFASVPEILDELRAGRMVVLVDDEKRENEGDLVCAAQHASPPLVNFMTKHARGLLCVALDADICDRLDLTPQSRVNTAQLGTAFTVSVDAVARFGVSTGVSASDRSVTIKLLADATTRPDDLARPGHIFPLRARTGGVLVRTGQTEGSVDLCRLAGLRPAAAIIEIMNDDGTMARLPELEALCREHSLKMCKVADVIAYRMAGEKLVRRVEQAVITTPFGPFDLIAYTSVVDPLPHVALVLGRVGKQEIAEPVLVRVHPHNILADVFGDTAQPGSAALHESMRQVQKAGEGAIVYMRQDSMGSGLLQRLQTMRPVGEAAAEGAATPEGRVNIGIGSQILRDLGLRQLRLLTNRPQPYHALEGFGLSVVEYVKLGG